MYGFKFKLNASSVFRNVASEKAKPQKKGSIKLVDFGAQRSSFWSLMESHYMIQAAIHFIVGLTDPLSTYLSKIYSPYNVVSKLTEVSHLNFRIM